MFFAAVIIVFLLFPPAFAQAETKDETLQDETPATPQNVTQTYKAPIYEVTVSGRKPILKDSTQDYSKMQGDELRSSPRYSTLEALSQKSAGVYVTARGVSHGVADGSSGAVNIRGLGGAPNSQVLIIEDGIPDYQGIFGHPIPDAYVPFLIEEALVLMGGDSVLYGTNAMGGALVLRSRWLEQEGFEILNDAAFGSYSTMKESLSVLANYGKWDVAGAFFGLTTDGHRSETDGSEIVGYAAARYRFSKDLRLSFRNKAVHLEGKDPGTASHPLQNHWYDVWRNNSSLRLVWEISAFELFASSYFNFGVHKLYDGFHSLDYLTGGNIEAEVKPHKKISFTLGLNTQHIKGDVENRIDDEKMNTEDLTDISFYNQAELRPLDSITIVIGSRELYSATYNFVFLYKGGLRWDIIDGFYAHTRYTRNFRQPTLRELYLPFPSANPELKPEYSRNWDFGLVYDSKYLEISTTVYRTRAENMIRYFGAWPSAEVVNIDNITIYGIEGNVALKNTGPFYLFFTANQQETGRYTRQNPNRKMDITLGFKENFSADFIECNLTGEWVHGLYMANYSRDKIDDVYSTNFVLKYHNAFFERKTFIEPYIYLRNLLDRQNEFIKGYPMPGFNILVGLKIGT